MTKQGNGLKTKPEKGLKRGEYNRLYPNHFDFGASLRKEWGLSCFNKLVRQYKANAKRRRLVFELTDERVRELTSASCSYCGSPPSAVMKAKDLYGEYHYNGIDRQNPTLGYVEGNVATACSVCNRSKSNLPLDVWLKWLQRIKDFK